MGFVNDDVMNVWQDADRLNRIQPLRRRKNKMWNDRHWAYKDLAQPSEQSTNQSITTRE